MSDTTIQRGWRYEDHIPYATPDSLDDLRGPLSGLVEVGGHIDTSMRPIYDLADPADRWALYPAVIRSGTKDEQVSLLNRDALMNLWPTMRLPQRCRRIWREKFPELTQISAKSA